MAPQGGDQVVADDHGVAVGGAGGPAGPDHVLQPVAQPLAHGQVFGCLALGQGPLGLMLIEDLECPLQGG